MQTTISKWKQRQQFFIFTGFHFFVIKKFGNIQKDEFTLKNEALAKG